MTTVDFKGEKFEPRANSNVMRGLYLAKVAMDGQKRIAEAQAKGDDTMLGQIIIEQQAALWDYIEHSLRPEDFTRFMAVADEQGAGEQDLYEFGAKMKGAAAERPTGQPTVSSDGPASTPETSVSRLEKLATDRFPGRPDKVMALTAGERMSEEQVAELTALLG